MIFKDRTDAGEELAEYLKNKGLKADLVLAVPRGGLPIGKKVADALNTSLDVVLARKIGAPWNPELAIGAVASDGSSICLNNEIIERNGIDNEYIEKKSGEEAEKARKKLETFRKSSEPPDVQGKTVVVVDDGVATGATTIASLRQLRSAGAGKLILAVPVGPEQSYQELRDEADEVIILETPRYFGAVGAFYDDFTQVTDEEVEGYLSRDIKSAS